MILAKPVKRSSINAGFVTVFFKRLPKKSISDFHKPDILRLPPAAAAPMSRMRKIDTFWSI
jgi:hypothetical protein